ncbi:hypothetical protein ABT160_42760 [Streptomyces sp. NPDC001941]|uniref:hypothetical protein n=1 Tax=Streptomyces sp. NPDC001941 TaxID=3154659 RepID=UPI0033198035
MPESNDALAVMLALAVFLHILALLGVALCASLVREPEEHHTKGRQLAALLLGRSLVQRTGRSPFISRLLLASGLLLAAIAVLSAVEAVHLAWTTFGAMLAAMQLASAYAWRKPAQMTSTIAAAPPEEDHPAHVVDASAKEPTTTDDPEEN